MKRPFVLHLSGLVLAVVFLACSCVPAATPPKTFVSLSETTGVIWKVIELRSDLNYEDAWQLLVDTLTKKWDIDEINDKTGYVRTTWKYENGRDKGSNGWYTYGRRITVKFTIDKKALKVKTEAYYEVHAKNFYYMQYGVDSYFNDDAFTEISGKLGRTTR